MASEYLQEWRHHSLSGQPVLVLGHLHSEKVFPDAQAGTSCVSPKMLLSGVSISNPTWRYSDLTVLHSCYSREMTDFLIVLSLLLTRRLVVLSLAQ